MTASTLFVTFSAFAILTPLTWAIIQIVIEPRRWVRILAPFLIAALAALALYSGMVARDHQAKELASLRPRTVSPEQRTELKARLEKGAPPIRIVYRLMDGEGKDYSEQLASAIREAGGTVLSIAGNSLNDLQGKVTVAVNDEEKTKAAANRLCDTLTAIKISCGGEITPGSLGGSPGVGEVLLIVGRK